MASGPWWDERSVAAEMPVRMPSLSLAEALPAECLVCIVALLAASPPDVAAAAGACRALRDAARAAGLTRRDWRCGGCLSVAFTSDVLVPQRPEPWAFLNDGPALAVDLENAPGLRRTGRYVKEANAFLRRGNDAAIEPATDAEALACASCGLYLGARCASRDHTWAAVCAAYVRRGRAGGGDDPSPLPPRYAGVLRCAGRRGAGCGAVLARHADVLSKDHTWFDEDGLQTTAWYMNSSLPSAVVAVDEAELQQLAQGMFITRTLACTSCGAVVGWRFESCHTWQLLSLDVGPQLCLTYHENVGRLGLVASAVRVTAD